MNDILSNLVMIITAISAFSLIWVSAALTNKKDRNKVKTKLRNMEFYHQPIKSAAELWSSSFEVFFGKKFLSLRQLITIPIYTLIVSGTLIGLWIVYLYIFKNPTYSFTASLPLNVKAALHDFYTKGIFASISIDFIAISLTKLCIKTGIKNNFKSFSFIFIFLFAFILVFFIFSIVTYYFRVEDMVLLYMEISPQDKLPIIPFTPIQNILSANSLVEPQTLIYFTSAGVMSTYFMPEPVIFYCAVISQLSLVFIFLSYQLSNTLIYIKNTCLKFVSVYGSETSGAYGVIGVVITSFCMLPLILFALYIVVNK